MRGVTRSDSFSHFSYSKYYKDLKFFYLQTFNLPEVNIDLAWRWVDSSLAAIKNDQYYYWTTVGKIPQELVSPQFIKRNLVETILCHKISKIYLVKLNFHFGLTNSQFGISLTPTIPG